MELNKIQKLVLEEYRKNGYLYMWNSFERLQPSSIGNIAELGLITTEVTEAMEALRSNKYEPTITEENLGIECADIIIRVLNFMSRKHLDAEEFILKAHKKNMKRGKFHGKLI